MPKIAIVRSRQLVQAGQNGDEISSADYGYSHHKKSLDFVSRELEALQIPYVYWSENDLNKVDLLHREGVTVIVALGLRVCAENTFQALVNLAEQGWIVLSGRDSFFYDQLDRGKTKRVMARRVRGLFQLTDRSYIHSRRLDKGQVDFRPSRFSWLTKNLADRPSYVRKWIVAVLAQSDVLASHGDITIEEAWSSVLNGTDDKLEGKSVPAFLIREYPATGGLFIYACFTLRRMPNSRQILRNLWRFRSRAAPKANREVQMLRTLVVSLTVIIGLLIGRELLGDTWPAYLGGIIVALGVGALEILLTDRIKQWTSA